MNQSEVGQFARLPNGERALVEVVGLPDGNIPARAVYAHIEGNNRGHRGGCWAYSLELLGYEIPKDTALTTS